MRIAGIVLMVVGIITFVLWFGLRFGAGIKFDRNCGGYLKRAADANTVELAKKELSRAIAYAEKEGFTEGYTSILYRTPDEDLGFWYQNLKASANELEIIKVDAPQLEKSNMLMKLRETLLDQQTITVPNGISIFPFNAVVCLWGCISGFIFCLGAFFLWRSENSY